MDQEIEAMSQITKALDSLEDEARARVLRWAGERFGVSFKKVIPRRDSEVEVETGDNEDDDAKTFETLADLFAAASPSTEADKLLVAAYWYQKIEGATELTSQQLNTDLKNLGHGITHISEKFDALMTQKPQLALQLKKAGLTKQARKKYKLTKAGLDRVDSMLTPA